MLHAFKPSTLEGSRGVSSKPACSTTQRVAGQPGLQRNPVSNQTNKHKQTMRCCRGDSSPSIHPPPLGLKAAHADRTGFVPQATRYFQSLGKHFHGPHPRQACTPWPEGGGRSSALSGLWLRRSGHRRWPEPGCRARSGRTLGGARRSHSGTGPAAVPGPAPHPKSPCSRQ